MRLNKKGRRNLDYISKIVLIVILDIFVTMVAYFFGLWFRYDFHFEGISSIHLQGYLSAMLPWCAISVAVFACFGLYNSVWVFVSTSELFRIIGAYLVLGILGVLLFRFDGRILPRSSMVVGFVFSFLGTVSTRFSYRMWRMARRKFNRFVRPGGMQNVMIIGGGDAGKMLIDEYNSSDNFRENVVCVIDDNPAKDHMRLCGVLIVGGRDKIQWAVKKYRVQKIVFAIPSISAAERKKILDICATTGCEVRTLPSISQLLSGKVGLNKLRKVDPQDLLGRDPVKVDLNEIMRSISGKVVMVTGGGGSIGSELCRQIARANPKQLIVLDIYENNAYDIQNELKRTHPDLNLEVLIGSVRNMSRLESIMCRYHPELIFHAAAHKHVPLMEDSPNEAIKNNVLGTYNMARAADQYGAKRFVLISTDKAVNPTNIMGASKRLCEMVVQMMNRRSKTEFVAVRFGNVLGSNGSVVPLFKKQIELGGPVTVTHPDVIRYFMTISEAVSLVLQAEYYAKGGEIFVLDMGEPVRIDAMARKLIRLSGYEPDVDIAIVYTGLRPGEKLYEEMLMKEEGLQETENKLIHIGEPIEMDDALFSKELAELEEACNRECGDMKEIVARIVPTYHPAKEPATV